MGGALILLMTSDDPPNLKGTILLALSMGRQRYANIAKNLCLGFCTVPWLKVSAEDRYKTFR